MKKQTIGILLAVGILTVAGILLFRIVFQKKAESTPPVKQKKAPVVQVFSAKKTTVSHVLEVTGSVEAYREARLASSAEGPVLHISVREGDRVKQGEELLSMGRKEGAEALIASLREELKKEEDNLRRTRLLVEQEAIPAEELDQARASYEKVRAQLVSAEEKVKDYSVTAPWSGVVSRLNVKEGEFVAPRTVLLEIYDPASLVVRAAVPEKHAAEIKAGMPVNVKLDVYPHDIFQGQVDRVYPYLDSRFRTRTMEISLDPSIDLLPGMFARMEVMVKKIDDAVVVPVEAVITGPEGPAVFIVKEGMALERQVELGIEEKNLVQIVSGIQAGDRVIIAGGEKIKNRVQISLSERKDAYPPEKKSDNPEGGGP
jgi:membrane fusion protein, multidrug efflux system